MAADGSINIDTKIDDSGIPKQLGKMKTSLAKAAKTLAQIGRASCRERV